MTEKKTAGQIAYEAHVAVIPTYRHSPPICGWADLTDAERFSWERMFNNAAARAAFASRKAEIG